MVCSVFRLIPRDTASLDVAHVAAAVPTSCKYPILRDTFGEERVTDVKFVKPLPMVIFSLTKWAKADTFRDGDAESVTVFDNEVALDVWFVE